MDRGVKQIYAKMDLDQHPDISSIVKTAEDHLNNCLHRFD